MNALLLLWLLFFSVVLLCVKIGEIDERVRDRAEYGGAYNAYGKWEKEPPSMWDDFLSSVLTIAVFIGIVSMIGVCIWAGISYR